VQKGRTVGVGQLTTLEVVNVFLQLVVLLHQELVHLQELFVAAVECLRLSLRLLLQTLA
jgi:hypothetical protein